jgi:hypothetical protein
MINSNLTKKQVRRMNTEKLITLLQDAPYQNRAEAIGNNETIQHVFEVLHERKEIDCEEAFCFEGCENLPTK